MTGGDNSLALFGCRILLSLYNWCFDEICLMKLAEE